MTAPLTPEVNVKFRATGTSEVQRGLKLVGSSGENAARQVGGSLRQIAGGAEMVARQGKVTGDALKQVISSGAEMAFMFGAGGPIVGALAIVGLAIYENITGGIKAARDEARKFSQDLADLRTNNDLAGSGKLSQRLYSGERFAVQQDGESDEAFTARRLGVVGLRSKVFGAQRVAQAGVSTSGQMTNAAQHAQMEYEKWLPILEAVEAKATAAAQAFDALARAEGQRAKNQVDIARQEYLKNYPLSLSQIAAHGKTDALLDPTLDLMRLGQFGPNGRFGVRLTPGQTQSPGPLGGLDGYRSFGLKPKDLGHTFESQFVSPLADSISKSIGDGIGAAISSGFDAAFAKGANIGKVSAAFGASAISTLGGVFKQIGMESLLGLEFMNAIKVAITSWNPAFGIAASLGLIALGSAMQSAGGRMNANSAGGGGSSGGGGGSSSPPTIIDRGFISPASSAIGAAGSMSTRNMIVLAPTIIGPNDPNAQRGILELVRNAERRGGVGTV
jgi:hypothetical protein